MNNLKTPDAGELNNSTCADQSHCELENELRLQLEKTQEFHVKLQKLQEKLSENKNAEEDEQIFNEIKTFFDLQICKDDLFPFFEFANKYQEYMKDVMSRFHNYKSDLIAEDNLLYVFGLYRKYIDDAFDEFIVEFKKLNAGISHVRKYLLSYSKFEKCIFYHAYNLCVHQGLKSPNFDDVNKMISTKPYGNSSVYPQTDIWQIVGFPGDRDHNAYRDYYCGLAIWQHELTKKQSEITDGKFQVQKNNFISNDMTNGTASDSN